MTRIHARPVHPRPQTGDLDAVRGRIARLKATSTDPMTSSHFAEVKLHELTDLDARAFAAIVEEKSPDWREKAPAFDAYFADVRAHVDARRAADPGFDALKDTRENFAAYLRHVVILHAIEERRAARGAAHEDDGHS